MIWFAAPPLATLEKMRFIWSTVIVPAPPVVCARVFSQNPIISTQARLANSAII